MISDDELNQVPSRNAELLHSFVGRRLARLVHHVEALESGRRNELFAHGGGPVQMVFDDQRQLLVSYSEALLSIIVELVSSPDAFVEWPASVEASDPEFSESRFSDLIGRQVTAVRVWQIDIDEDHLELATAAGRRVFSPKALSRPREAVLSFELGEGTALFFRTGASDLPCNFGLSTDLRDDQVPLRLLHLDDNRRRT